METTTSDDKENFLNIPEISDNQEKSREKNSRCFPPFIIVSTIAILAIVTCIFVFVNKELVKKYDSCEKNKADNHVLAKLVEKEGRFFFRYEEHDCPVPGDISISDFDSETNIFVYFSDNYKRCSLTKDQRICSKYLAAFNISYTVIGIAITAVLIALLCTLVWYPCIKEELHRYM